MNMTGRSNNYGRLSRSTRTLRMHTASSEKSYREKAMVGEAIAEMQKAVTLSGGNRVLLLRTAWKRLCCVGEESRGTEDT